MVRTRVNGTKFEEDIEKVAGTIPEPNYLLRLHTPQTRVANISNIADFILFANKTVILEAKETKEKSFSLTTFQQKDKIDEFIQFLISRVSFAPATPLQYKVSILVHFIKYQKFVLYFFEPNQVPVKVLHAEKPEGLEFASLSDALQYLANI